MFRVLYPFDYKIPSGYIGSIAEQDFIGGATRKPNGLAYFYLVGLLL